MNLDLRQAQSEKVLNFFFLLKPILDISDVSKYGSDVLIVKNIAKFISQHQMTAPWKQLLPLNT